MKKGFRRLAVLVLLLGLLVISLPAFSASEEGVRLTCLNIGKADCLLLQWDGQAFLIDTGYEQNYPAVKQMLSYYNITRLDGVFLTHCHKDHEGGLTALALSDLPIDAWYAAEICYDVKADAHAASLAAALRGESVCWLSAGNVIPAGKDASFTVLGPVYTDTENENNNSLVLRFDSPHGSILLAGDMKENEENSLLLQGLLSPCELLKVGHHGDSGATKKAFLSAVQPKTALISTNTHEEHDTPAPSTLERLSKIGCSVYITQNAQDALEATLLRHAVTVRDIAWPGVPARCAQLSMSIRFDEDVLSLRNDSGAPVTLRDASLFSQNRDILFELPDIALEPGQSFRIGTKKTVATCDFYVDKKRIWSDGKPDTVILYDAFGRSITWADNGIVE